jgi:hypothetical protein
MGRSVRDRDAGVKNKKANKTINDEPEDIVLDAELNNGSTVRVKFIFSQPSDVTVSCVHFCPLMFQFARELQNDKRQQKIVITKLKIKLSQIF